MDQMQPADTKEFIERLKSPIGGKAQENIQDAVPSPSRRTLACMVTHGMGQQVRFETAALVAEAFQRSDNRKPTSIKTDRVQLTADGDLLSCIKMLFPGNAKEPETEVHIFEGYWAPLTEGKISLTKTLLFLLSAFWRGVKTSLKKTKTEHGKKKRHIFTRWTFGQIHEYGIKRNTLRLLL